MKTALTALGRIARASSSPSVSTPQVEALGRRVSSSTSLPLVPSGSPFSRENLAGGVGRHFSNQPSKRGFLDNVVSQMREALALSGIAPAKHEAILSHRRRIEAGFTVHMDDGSERSFNGWRILHSHTRGAGKGGIRFACDLSEDTVRALAAEMPNKSSLFQLPIGGAKGGVPVHAASLSRAELARVMRGYVRAILDQCWSKDKHSSGQPLVAFGPKTDVPAPDVGTSPPLINLMDVATDEYLGWLSQKSIAQVDGIEVPESLHALCAAPEGTATPYLDHYLELHAQGQITTPGLIATFTGKSLGKGGSLGRDTATGLGLAYGALELLKRGGRVRSNAESFSEIEPGHSPVTVAIQGFGNVGWGAATSLHKLGAQIVSIAEFDGAPYAIRSQSDQGIDQETIAQMVEFKKGKGTLRNFPGTEILGIDEFWQQSVDLLAPCAREGELTAARARTLGAKYVVEGANGPTEKAAVEVLAERNIPILPDILANSGGVTVSFYEMTQNLQGETWDTEKVAQKLKGAMQKAFAEVANVSENSHVSLRMAAMITAMRGLE